MTEIKRYQVIIEDRLHNEKIWFLTDKTIVVKEIINILELEARKEKENENQT